ncbi:hypothetical protein LOTGIDRAFT_158798 [Lottia gigantea]|uniref:Uncharacterized protein n=1 Tax=Lottia gigantea TaxID=225164 RepID=V4A4P5_LOTGI|nr:hypothetical protein LOTGIDRAFT_158798 [Lottia gigantea]ESO98848.1 hypothetical protein LOTGIDRAFT_158798 [Lottia gigantea]
MATGLGKEFPFNLQNGNVHHKKQRGRQQQRRRHLNRVMDVEEILALLEELKQEQEQEKFEQSQRIRREREQEEKRQLSKASGITESIDILCETCERLAGYSDLDPEAQRKQRYAQQKRRQKLQKRILDLELLVQFLKELKLKQSNSDSDEEGGEETEARSNLFLFLFFGIFVCFVFCDLYKSW